MQPQPCEVRCEVDEYEREEQWLAKQRKHMAVLRTTIQRVFALGEVFETSLTPSNPFNVHLPLFSHFVSLG